jgi:uncharacterized protein YaiI (UPF0178 family)
MPFRIWIDADACPNEVKRVIYRASERLGIPTFLVANVVMEANWPQVTPVLVSHDFNAADDHIADNAVTGDVVITADIPLAARVVDKGAVALDPRGEVYDENNVGERLAMRDLMQELRGAGYVQGGPAPLGTQDKGRFAAALDRLLTRKLRED